jgi:hypothetical protein
MRPSGGVTATAAWFGGQLGSGQLGSWAAINPLDSLVRGVIFSTDISKVQFFLFFVKIFYLVWGIWPHFYTYFIVTMKTQKREILAAHRSKFYHWFSPLRNFLLNRLCDGETGVFF